MSLIRKLESLESAYAAVWWNDDVAHKLMQQIEEVEYAIEWQKQMDSIVVSYHQGANP